MSHFFYIFLKVFVFDIAAAAALETVSATSSGIQSWNAAIDKMALDRW